MRDIYLDNAATTRVRPEVAEKMLQVLTETYGNPSSIYGKAREARRAMDTAREEVAALMHATAREIYFTGSGTEADNWAIRGVCAAREKKGKHIITTAVEHHAVLHTCAYMEKQGYRVTYLQPDAEGIVSAEQVKNAIEPDTVLITVMFANNEIGTIMPIADIGKVAREHGIVFHTDAVQAYGHVPIDVEAMNIDVLSLSAHKIHGPKGVGALYVRKGLNIERLLHGGGQERSRRPGTENVAGIVALGMCAAYCKESMQHVAEKLTMLREQLIDGILSTIPHTRLNGSRTSRLPGNVNISFEFVEGESILLMLDRKGISASSGSACTSGSLDPSHVLLAIGLPHEKAHGSLRLSFSEENTEEDVQAVIDALVPIIERLREMSPLYEDFVKGVAAQEA